MLAVRRSHHGLRPRHACASSIPSNRKVLAYLREYEGETILCVANLSRTPQAVELDLSDFAGRVPVELNGGSLFPPIGQLTYLLTLPPYGFYWFMLATRERARRPGTRRRRSRCRNIVTLVLRDRLAEALASRRAARCSSASRCRPISPKRRWFAAKDQTLESRAHRLSAPLPGGDRELLLAEIEATTDGGTSRWLLPLVDRLGGRADRRRCRRSSRWRACAAAGASAC